MNNHILSRILFLCFIFLAASGANFLSNFPNNFTSINYAWGDTDFAVVGGHSYIPIEGSSSMSSRPHTSVFAPYFPRLHGNEAIHFDYLYTGGGFHNACGGMITRNATTYIGIADFSVTIDTQKLGWWKNGTFYSNAYVGHGAAPSEYIDDTMYCVAMAYPSKGQVSEHWYEHAFAQDSLHVRIGKLDPSEDIFFLTHTADFLNDGATVIPTTRLPMRDLTAYGIMSSLKITDKLCVVGGIFDGHGHGDLLWLSNTGRVYGAGEIEYHTNLFGCLPGLAFFGAWGDDCIYPTMIDATQSKTGNSGLAGGFEQAILRDNICDANDHRGIYTFLRWGNAKKDRSVIDNFWGAGIVRRGIGARREDSAGIGLSRGAFSNDFRTAENLPHSYESSLECYYKAQIFPHISLQPNMQYIRHPSGFYEDSILIGLIFQATL